jgi:hypothetical protein
MIELGRQGSCSQTLKKAIEVCDETCLGMKGRDEEVLLAYRQSAQHSRRAD